MSAAPTGTMASALSSSPSPSSADTTAAFARRDGRTALEIRGKEMRLSEMADFDGSSWYAQGQTAVMVSVHGPTLAKNEAYDTCLVRVRVQHARGLTPSAGGAERAVYEEMKVELLTRTDAVELASLLESTIDAVFMRDRFPRCVLVVDVVVMQDDGSLPAVALNAVMCALLDAGLPCRTTMAAVSVAAIARAGDAAGPSGASSSVEFLLDPTAAEEVLAAGYSASSTNTTAATANGGGGGGGSGVPSSIAEKSDLSGSAGSNGMLQNRYQCVSTGVFVFSNPACGGGLLAQLVRHRRGGGEGAGGALSLEAYGQMMTLAERASTVLFDFFRQCNVAE